MWGRVHSSRFVLFILPWYVLWGWVEVSFFCFIFTYIIIRNAIYENDALVTLYGVAVFII